MPRKEAKLAPFLENALEGSKYKNLIYEDRTKKVFCLYLPHKTSSLSKKNQLIFKDWFAQNGKKYINFKSYTCARQAMTASLRKSDYVEPICLFDNKLICRILSKEEVKEKKNRKSKKLKIKQEDNESGYESALNSPKGFIDCQHDKKHLRGIEHDHAYVLNPPGKESVEGSGNCYDVHNYSNETENTHLEDGTFDGSLLFDRDNSFQPYLENDCLNEDFNDIPLLSDDYNTLDDIDIIPFKRAISEELQVPWQAMNSIDVKENIRRLYYCVKY